MRLMIALGVTIFGGLGNIIGQLINHQNIWGISGWSILLGAIGSFFGIWAGYRAGQYLGQ